jgi:uncharacterized membrane protein
VDWFNPAVFALWAIILVAQNASFTWVSRARNSGSVGYHAIAAVGSNGIWFASQVIVIQQIRDALQSHDSWRILFTGVFYVICTVVGSVSMHKFLMTQVEKGKLKVGA